MGDILLIWSLPCAIALHNLEEAIWLPAWSEKSGSRWIRPVCPFSFRFAVCVLTVVAFLVAAWAHFGGRGSLGHYLLATYGLAQGLNVFFPHLAATLVTRTYVPGLLTGIVFVLPSAVMLLYRSLRQGQLQMGRLLIVAAIAIPVAVVSIPFLFRIGTSLRSRLVSKAQV